MNKLLLSIFTLLIALSTVWCAQQTTVSDIDTPPAVQEQPTASTWIALNLDQAVYVPVADPEILTVNDEPITISNRLEIGDIIEDLPLDRPIGEFDKIEQVQLSGLAWNILLYSVPSLDTPVCTRQTKEIEEAAKQFTDRSFVIVSHDTPFALKRFCGDENIINVLTLSDWRRKDFAKANGLYMEEYDLMMRAVIVLNSELEVLYIDYADEVTEPVDLINAFKFMESVE